MTRRAQHGDKRVLPQPVQSARHDVVHHVVLGGDGVEHIVDAALLLGQTHGLEAEMGGVVAGVGTGRHAGTLAFLAAGRII